MFDKKRLECLRLAKELTESTDIEDLINIAEHLSSYLEGKRDKNFVYALDSVEKFVSNLKMLNPAKGLIPFSLYEHQKSLLFQLTKDVPLTVVCSARQMGISSLLLAYSLYEAARRPNQKIFIVGEKYKSILEKIDFIKMFIETSMTYIPPLESITKGAICFDNNSSIIGRRVSGDAFRGIKATHIIVDNAAYIPFSKDEEFLKALEEQMKLGCKVIMSSCLNIDQGLFYDLWTKNDERILKIKVPWYQHPDRDENWAEATKNIIGEDKFSTEYECEIKK